MTPRPHRPSIAEELPRLGRAGSRSAELHTTAGDPAPPTAGGSDAEQRRGEEARRMGRRFEVLRWAGTLGAILIALGGFGGGALPVVENPWFDFTLGAAMGRMMLAANAVVFVGVGLLVGSWLAMAPFVGVTGTSPLIDAPRLRATLIAWVLPITVTAPLFTQDIYSYLANGSIVRQGFDPYAAGPVEILGVDHHLARSVPFIWAHSPSPYGPVALGIAAAISRATADSILWGVLAHRAVSVAGILAAAWASTRLARRCNVQPAAALWLGVLNPLTILHLVGGIHNEAVMLGFVLVGMELGLRGIGGLEERSGRGWAWLAASAALLSCAGMVKVTGFLGLGFVGMALARHLATRGARPWAAIAGAAALQTAVLVCTAVLVALVTGIGFGWVTGQGGAASIRSWLSLTTDVGVAGGTLGMWLGLGDHTDAMLMVTRGAGVAVAAAFLVRMLWATFKDNIHPVGGLGVATLVMVVLFPVVHPWYPLWAILPLAAWANRIFFRASVAVYSAVFSFLVLPRGLGLPPSSVATVYLTAAVSFAALMGLALIAHRRYRSSRLRGLHSPA